MLYFDFETTNKSFGDAGDLDNRILMVAWVEDSSPKVRYFAGDIMKANGFWAACRRQSAPCAYHAKFEMKWLARLGFDINSKHWHDPMLAEKILLGNRQLPMNLGAVSERYGYDTKDPMIDSMMKAGVCPSEMPQKRLLARCVRDVRTMRQIMRRQMKELKGRNALHLYRTRCDFSVVLAQIEAEGMILDREKVYDEYAQASMRITLLGEKLRKITGGINLNSSDQVAAFLYDTLKFPEIRGANGRILRNKPSKRYPTGKPKTDKATMLWLAGKATTLRQIQFIELRQQYSKTNAALSKNLEFFKGVCDEYDCKFHAQFNQVVAATHRLTSSGKPLQFKQFEKPKSVQFQNMPREFKGCFSANKV